MIRTARLMAAIAVGALALPVAMAQTTDTKKAKDAPMTEQEKKLENTGKETRTMAPPPKMTPEEKKADKAAKRKAPTKEEEEKAKKATPGG